MIQLFSLTLPAALAARLVADVPPVIAAVTEYVMMHVSSYYAAIGLVSWPRIPLLNNTTGSRKSVPGCGFLCHIATDLSVSALFPALTLESLVELWSLCVIDW